MKIETLTGKSCRRARRAAFTLIEVAFASAIAALVVAGMFEGYNMASRRAQFSACNLAANAAATRLLEQVVSADWIPSTQNTALLGMSGTQAATLCLPSVNGNLISCTNTTSVTEIPGSPPYAYIQVQCVWTFPSYGGTYTNTVAVLRAPNI